jgi:hypothetical protein
MFEKEEKFCHTCKNHKKIMILDQKGNMVSNSRQEGWVLNEYGLLCGKKSMIFYARGGKLK